MGVINYECIIGITWNIDVIDKFEKYLLDVPVQFVKLFHVNKSIVNNNYNIVLTPSGSKKGWKSDIEYTKIRKSLINFFESFKYTDGSNCISWVEVGFGEYGQIILNGNNKNKYTEDEYYDENSSKKGEAELIISKHRNGPLGKIKLQFNQRIALFSNLAKSHQVEKRGEGNV